MTEDKKTIPEEQVEAEQVVVEEVEAELVENDESAQPQEEAEASNEDLNMIEVLNKKLALAEQQIVDQQADVARAQADVVNARRIAAQDVQKAHKFALVKFADGLLPVIDSLEMAISHADKEDETLKPMIEGVELTLKSMLDTVDKFGLKVIDPKDEAFDPEKHQAMSMRAVPDVAPNQVIAVMQKGYELNGRVIRPAMVMVSKAED
ncbi:co-chaperone GrpE [Psychromonas ingrahamii 37]|uniref:Protein GrpE n=1 Tax=Psychromonas ingrahamii (strain DSM 17664 / CCUG 51855 / 37) TaxID=357804 RepID=GRPE_PSYIN|nr:nucleotide exchange factor GrpE [Psychromonas ingrahamii]A1STE3.1 RecName: Full=Protein GrpE; AltName: Full=HSP-70 cofactor [Psychromonas ingrahamii 37]ABM02758.1 co-chaperone GrpE [Psychromonas ingrahamii 37]